MVPVVASKLAHDGLLPMVKLMASVATRTSPTSSTATFRLCRVTGYSLGALTASSVLHGGVTLAGVTGTSTTFTATPSAELSVTTAGWHFVQIFHSVNPAQFIDYSYDLVARPV